MKKLYLFVLALLAVQLSAFQVNNKLRTQANLALKLPVNPPKTVPYVNLTRYSGVWYQQASIPAPFQADCTNTFANYSLYQDESIRVINTCYKQGEPYQMIGRAVPDPADTEHTNAKLKVRFPVSPVDGDYWVVRLDQSYSYVVVGSPSYNFMWIMYRSPRMPTELYNTIIEDLKKDDFPVQRLKKTIIN